VSAASDARAVTEIKARYAADSTLSAWDISCRGASKAGQVL